MTGHDRGSRQWTTPADAFRLCLQPWALRRTLATGAVVGVVLSVVNQGGVVLAQQATTATWVRVALNFVVPVIVSSTGVLTATRAAPDRHVESAEPR